MNRDTVLRMVRSLPDVKEDGGAILIENGWEVSLHAGRNGVGMNVQQVTRIKIDPEFVMIETRKGQRVVLLIDEVRGLTAEPSSTERKGNRPGFV